MLSFYSCVCFVSPAKRNTNFTSLYRGTEGKEHFYCDLYRIGGYLYWPTISSAPLVRNLGMATVHWSNLIRYVDDLSDYWDHLGL